MNLIKPAWHWRFPPSDNPLVISDVDSISIHHTAHPSADIWEVERWHLERDNGTWKGFGYNWWIGKDGVVCEGRGFNEGAGVLNQNGHIISIVFQGDYHNTDKLMPPIQYASGIELIKYLIPFLPNLQIIVGHSYFCGTECPGQYFPLLGFTTIRDIKRGDKSMLLKKGDKSPAVAEMQRKLNKFGYILVVDGDFGAGTENVLKDFQRKNNLVSDGIAGPMTLDALDNKKPNESEKPEPDYGSALKNKHSGIIRELESLILKYK